MARNSLHLFLTLLAFSFLISLPTSKSSRLLVHGNQAISPTEDALEMSKEENMNMAGGEFGLSRRMMDFEINKDYVVPGSNSHHTPNPPVKV